jgi:hypothetical protein
LAGICCVEPAHKTKLKFDTRFLCCRHGFIAHLERLLGFREDMPPPQMHP